MSADLLAEHHRVGREARLWSGPWSRKSQLPVAALFAFAIAMFFVFKR
jgi:hypothetical protein